MISLIDAGSVANGPSITVTDSPTWKSMTRISGLSDFLTGRGARIFSTSSKVSGLGWWALPTNPVTPGVLRTADTTHQRDPCALEHNLDKYFA